MEKTLNEQIGERLKEIRSEQQLSQLEMANAIDISIDSLEDYETGKIPLPVPVMQKISCQYSISIDWLVSGLGAKVMSIIEDGDFKEDTLLISLIVDDMKRRPLIRKAIIEAYEEISKFLDNMKEIPINLMESKITKRKKYTKKSNLLKTGNSVSII